MDELRKILLEDTVEDTVLTEEDYEEIIDKLLDFLETIDPSTLPEEAQDSLYDLYETIETVFGDDETEEDDALLEYKIRRISKAKHRKAHYKYLKMKRKMGSKIKMKAKIMRRSAKYKAWLKRYKARKKTGRTGKIKYT